jgi:Flp pilus assembly protein TadG
MHSRKSRTVRNSESGQAMVEFLLVSLFIFILFVSMIQMIMFMYAYSTLADAAKEGVRYAVVHGTGYSAVNGGVGCSGPGNPSVTPVATCADSTGSNVITAVAYFATLSAQTIPTGNVTVCYDPNSSNNTCSNGANTNSSFGGPCSAPGCLVRVTVAHAYNPLFGLGWPSFTLYAASNGRIMN